MKKLLCAAASVAALALSMGPAFAASKPILNAGASQTATGATPGSVASDLAEMSTSTHAKTLESTISGVINSVCAFDTTSPQNYKLDLYNAPNPAAPLKVTFNFPIKCNFGTTYGVSVTPTNKAIKNLNETARTWDVAYTPSFKLENKSPLAANPWAPKPLTTAATTLVSSIADVAVDESSGRGYVNVDGALTLTANATAPIQNGTAVAGYAWRAGVYREDLTFVVTPAKTFAVYYGSPPGAGPR